MKKLKKIGANFLKCYFSGFNWHTIVLLGTQFAEGKFSDGWWLFCFFFVPNGNLLDKKHVIFPLKLIKNVFFSVLKTYLSFTMGSIVPICSEYVWGILSSPLGHFFVIESFVLTLFLARKL